MIYRSIGIMSGSSLDGLDIAFVEFTETAGKWSFDIKAATCLPYSDEWAEQLKNVIHLPAADYLRLHSKYGHYIGQQVNAFIEANHLSHQVQIIASHGHTSFHEPANKMTAQLGDGAAIAATTGINVVSDLRAMDIALGGQGAPIVPMGEKLLWKDYPLLLNIGGIANISASLPTGYVAFDICPANRVLNMLAADNGLAYDDGGQLAASGFVRDEPLFKINQLDYYSQPFPKSLANHFGTDEVYPILKSANLSIADALRTMVEHIVIQTTRSIGKLLQKLPANEPKKLLVTGGGAYNSFLVQKLQASLKVMNVEVVVPDAQLIEYKEAVVMALLGVLRWREENTVFHSVTGASRSSIGGTVWIGQEA
ncbi:MAG TPA: anhydro-N-acetylmuramic acid kinase [Phnomibacter sp.]|nr:anhydro-N-acetylmuramic acid kinase [Phnomibacter sp.]